MSSRSANVRNWIGTLRARPAAEPAGVRRPANPRRTGEAARALGAALPLLKKARKVVLLSVGEDNGASPEVLGDLANRLSWHGIAAETRFLIDERNRAPGELLLGAAREAGADLLVIGGYGHGPVREAVFGGVTAALIRHAECPVFMMH